MIASVVHQFQTASGIFQSDARTAAVCIVLGIVGVVADKDELVIILLQANIDGRRPVAADTMFESILNQRDKQQWGNLRLRITDHEC